MEGAMLVVVGQGQAQGTFNLSSYGTCLSLSQPRIPPALAHHPETSHCSYNQTTHPQCLPQLMTVKPCLIQLVEFLFVFRFWLLFLIENFSHSQN